MEGEGLRKMIQRWINNRNISSYVHDKDAKTAKIIRDSGWNITEFIDTNHAMKSFRRKLNKYKNLSPTHFRGIQKKLEKFFQYLLKVDMFIKDKIQLWKNVSQHFAGNHALCIKNGPSKDWTDINVGNNLELLNKFLEKTADLLSKCDLTMSTQMNESLHAMKAHFASKNICWKSSWPALVSASILNLNEDCWALQLYTRLNLPPLSKYCLSRLKRIEFEKMMLRRARRSNEYKMKENQRRREKRKKVKKDNENSEYKGLRTKRRIRNFDTNGKRKYHTHKMPKKIGKLNIWFKEKGFKGTQTDEDDNEEWTPEEEEEYESTDEDYLTDDLGEQFKVLLLGTDEEESEIDFDDQSEEEGEVFGIESSDLKIIANKEDED